jgi:hypothetical protein
MGKRKKAMDAEFLWGYTLALANVYRICGEPGIVLDTMRGDGITLAELEASGAEECDLEAVRECWHHRRRTRERYGAKRAMARLREAVE